LSPDDGLLAENTLGQESAPGLADPGSIDANPLADFSNTSFVLTDDNGNVHHLDIQSQTAQPDGTAAFTAQWNGQYGIGTLAYDDAGNVHLTFNADNCSFDGTIAGVAGAYHIDGNLTGADGNAVHAAGDQALPPVSPVTDFTNVSFALIEDNGAAHQLQITTQTAQPDGSATFTGVCDGHNGTGTLAFDATGNVHLTFAGDDNSTVDGLISGTPDAYQFDGTYTSADGQAVHVMVGPSSAQAAPVTDFTSVSFALTDGDGTPHELQVESQTAQADGSATLTTLWDGVEVSGTLTYDSAGNVRMTFSGDAVQFDGTISGIPGAFQIDGLVMADGADPFQVSGSQGL
jgi:hypothetical protein